MKIHKSRTNNTASRKRFDELNPDLAYDTFKKTYDKATGKSWDKYKFQKKAMGWEFYGDENDSGWIAIRRQGSGMIKLVGMAGSIKGILEGLKQLMVEEQNTPIWGMVSTELKSMATRRGFNSPSGVLMKFLVAHLPKSIFGNAKIKNVDLNGNINIEYQDIGLTTKNLIGNKAYFDFLKKSHFSKIQNMGLPKLIQNNLMKEIEKL